MTDEPSLSDELSKNRYSRRGTKRYGDPDVAKEKRVLTGRAQALALGVLRERHREEYDGLYDQAKKEVGLTSDEPEQ